MPAFLVYKYNIINVYAVILIYQFMIKSSIGTSLSRLYFYFSLSSMRWKKSNFSESLQTLSEATFVLLEKLASQVNEVKVGKI